MNVAQQSCKASNAICWTICAVCIVAYLHIEHTTDLALSSDGLGVPVDQGNAVATALVRHGPLALSLLALSLGWRWLLWLSMLIGTVFMLAAYYVIQSEYPFSSSTDPWLVSPYLMAVLVSAASVLRSRCAEGRQSAPEGG